VLHYNYEVLTKSYSKSAGTTVIDPTALRLEVINVPHNFTASNVVFKFNDVIHVLSVEFDLSVAAAGDSERNNNY